MKKLVISCLCSIFFIINSCVIVEPIPVCIYNIEINLNNLYLSDNSNQFVGILKVDGGIVGNICFNRCEENDVCYNGVYALYQIAPNEDYRKYGIDELDFLSEIMSGGNVIIGENRNLAYSSENIQDITRDSDKYRQYRINIDCDDL